jgi:hypothetical protein
MPYNYYYNKYPEVIDDTIEDMFSHDGVMVDTTPFTDLEFDFQVSCITNIIKASRTAVESLSNTGKDISIPYIGAIKIKDGTKVANTVKEEVAIKHGYKCYDDIPNAIRFDLKTEISDIMRVRMMALKMNRKDYNSNKVITNINIFKLVKNK